MARRFARNSILAIGVFLIMAILVYTNLDFAEPVTEYVQFVVSTDFSFKPVLERVGLLQKLANWDLGALRESWSPNLGR